MKKNVGKVDMIIRLVIGVIAASIGIVYQSWWGLIAIIPILTAFINYCPLYSIFGCTTCSDKEAKSL
ncbi:MAG TPA: DUF2892 domain-containing protein [Bacteroidales bacterium]|nr:DUF2892 domain-containing protein [Bacteroidales bacterium]